MISTFVNNEMLRHSKLIYKLADLNENYKLKKFTKIKDFQLTIISCQFTPGLQCREQQQ